MSTHDDHDYGRGTSVHLGPLSLRLERRPRRWTGRAPLAVTAAAAMLALVVLAAPAGADTSASVTATVSVLVRSVSATPSTFAFNKCFFPNNKPAGPFASLPFPNGNCGVSPDAYVITLSFGAAPSSLAMSATNFSPSDGGTPWTFCAEFSSNVRADLPACAGPALSTTRRLPGTDQVQLNLSTPLGVQGTDVSNTPYCAFGGTRCAERSGGTDSVWPVIEGPNTTTDASLTFSSTITFYAMPTS